MVIENGTIVSSYVRDDVDPKEPADVYSVTKGWISFLFGTLVHDGKLSLDETLGDIFPDDDSWASVTDGSTDFRKGVTVEELLTMTSGLLPGLGYGEDPQNRGSWGGGLTPRFSFLSEYRYRSQRRMEIPYDIPNPKLYHQRAHWHDS